MKGWINDLALGVRLSVGGGRQSWIRLVLTGLGIGLGVAVLLAAVSVPSAMSARDTRADLVRTSADSERPIPGVDALYREMGYTQYRSRTVTGYYLRPAGPNAPVPPGIARIPGDGEILLSPALAKLLESPAGELLRPRFPQRVVGTISQAGLDGPVDLQFFAGEAKIVPDGQNMVYRFGDPQPGKPMNAVLWLLTVVGIVVLLFPVLVFVGVSTRLAGPQRDRRLAALRLVGAGAHRVRRIASGEALLGAIVGLLTGFAVFLFARQFTESISIAQVAVFKSDFTPSLPLTAAIIVLVPVLAVATSLIAMRRTVVEPLGVVRQGKPVRRRLWWRLVPIVVGIGLLVTQFGLIGGDSESQRQASEGILITGISLLLLGIPLLLPWLVEHSVGRLRGGAPSWQLAFRRLQMDSGTAARVVGGVAVVLAGAIALQTVLASAEQSIMNKDAGQPDVNQLVVSPRGKASIEGVRDTLANGKGVKEVHELQYRAGTAGKDRFISIIVGNCAALRTQLKAEGCRDGSAYVLTGSSGQPAARAGEKFTLVHSEGNEERRGPEWTVPPVEESAAVANSYATGIYVTPGALGDVDLPPAPINYQAVLDPAVPDAVEHARNAIGGLNWLVHSYFVGETDRTEAEQVLAGIRRGLMAGSVLTLLLAGASLLVLALEQVRERRRPLAVLAASGVPRGVLARSLLWQNMIPLVLAMLVAVATGAGLGAMLLKILSEPVVLDWPGIGMLTAAAAALVFLVTLFTLPSLRRATGALGLRSE